MKLNRTMQYISNKFVVTRQEDRYRIIKSANTFRYIYEVDSRRGKQGIRLRYYNFK